MLRKIKLLTCFHNYIQYEPGHCICYKIFYAPAIFMGGVGLWGERGAYSITAVRPYCLSILYKTKMVSIQYLLKRLVYWSQILYTGI